MDLLIIFLARYLIVGYVLAVLWILWLAPKHERAHYITLSILTLPLVYIAAKALGYVYFDPRPFVVGNFVPLVPSGAVNGLPSLHTLIAATLGVIVFTKKRALGSLLLIISLIIGGARIAAGVHHTIDIFASLVIAVAIVSIMNTLLYARLPRLFR